VSIPSPFTAVPWARQDTLRTTHPDLPHVGTYRRELPVGLERLYENALDWEHLPWLHRSTFEAVECFDAGPWGFRAGVELVGGTGEPVVIELALDRESRRWITRTVAGAGSGTEIWTHAFATSERHTDVVVDFFVPDVTPEHRAAVGEYYCRLYARLYDEDVSMMTERQGRLDQRSGARGPTSSHTIELGPLAALRARLPLVVDVAGREYRVIEVDGELTAHTTVCPHRLGPLARAGIDGDIIRCPWHGYRFDVRTGENLDGHSCRLPDAPRMHVSAATGAVTISQSSTAS
jgi:nitrite reductase/ring-hydroxylating ferredoxin subunit